MAKNLTIILEDRPGTLADIGDLLGKEDINIEGLCGFPCESKGVFNILVEDAGSARRALEGADITIQNECDVIVLEIGDRPGEFGKTCRKIADAGVNVNLAYVASKNRLVLGADDLNKALTAIE
jgi:hypothetical protein